MKSIEAIELVRELCKFPKETEWVEFKGNNEDPNEIGEYLSALSNSAALEGKIKAYMVWGVENKTHDIIGTTFQYGKSKVGGEELENWLLHLLSPKIDFNFMEVVIEDKNVVVLEIGAAFRHPVRFKGVEYIRVGSYKKKLKDFPEKERELWRVFDKTPFAKGIAKENLADEEVLALLDYPKYFSLLEIPLPSSRDSFIEALEGDSLIVKNDIGKWNITNLGAVLFAKELSQFPSVERKAIRVIQYEGIDKMVTIREQTGNKGYACCFEELIHFINTVIPSNEVVGKALRKNVPMFPDIAIRELFANAIIHQDFYITGTAPMIEIFTDRIEIMNPGKPLVKTDRFLDCPPKSRNEALAAFMRRTGVCEQRGSGVDKVILQTALYQLPAPLFEEKEESISVVLFAHKDFGVLNKDERVRACYWHACLQYVNRQPMTNSTLRERFALDKSKGSQISRVINAAIDSKMIKKMNGSGAKSEAKYAPYWV